MQVLNIDLTVIRICYSLSSFGRRRKMLMRCPHMQSNFKFDSSKAVIHQNRCWLWKIKKHRFFSVPGALMWLWCSVSCKLNISLHSWCFCCVKGRERFACMASYALVWTQHLLESQTNAVCHMVCWIWVCRVHEFPNFKPGTFLTDFTHWCMWFRPSSSKCCYG